MEVVSQGCISKQVAMAAKTLSHGWPCTHLDIIPLKGKRIGVFICQQPLVSSQGLLLGR